MRCHPVVLQLQFLPLLYAQSEEKIAVSDLPENPDPRLIPLDQPKVNQAHLSSWGSSLSLLDWAKQKGFSYSIPDWEIIRTVNSKIFSYLESRRLPGSALIESAEDAKAWIEQTPGPKVFKTAYGTAGTGHFHVGVSSNLDSFLTKQFALGLPVIGEPWVERLFDFSTQWKGGTFLGATVFETDPKGVYKATLAGAPEKIFGPFLWALEEHRAAAQPIVEKITRMGFFGHFGIDAYVYRADRIRVQPIVEINGRKTMSWAALQTQQTKFPDSAIRLVFSQSDRQSEPGLLPSELVANGKKVLFSRNISLEKLR
jgi:hypothetical protein